MIENAIDKAIKSKSLIVASIDDYTVVRSIQRPSEEQISHATYMCMIVFRVFENISAISWESPFELNNPDRITSNYCVLKQSLLWNLCTNSAKLMFPLCQNGYIKVSLIEK